MSNRLSKGLVALAVVALVGVSPAAGGQENRRGHRRPIRTSRCSATRSPTHRPRSMGFTACSTASRATTCRGRARTSSSWGRSTSTAQHPTASPTSPRTETTRSFPSATRRAARRGLRRDRHLGPAPPEQVGFIDATDGSFPGEGAHTIRLNTRFFQGQILVGNNEICDEETGEGGLSIWDVTDPLTPRC